ncbi:MAG: SAM-dependent methyltransferase [Chloroflexota bacterium]
MSSTESIIDDKKPNAGRIYDYLLGGYHNFEIDRQAAKQVLARLPFMSKFVRLQRWSLQDLAEELTIRRGYEVIVDFASGLPTNDHIHHKVSPDTTVIYSDYDPTVVEYAWEILKSDHPNTHFFQADASHPAELLERPEVQQILSGRRKVAFVYWGVSIFLPDDSIKRAAHELYDWAAPGSCLAFNAQGADINTDYPGGDQIVELYARMGTPLYPRSLAHYKELIQPWHIDGEFIPLLKWHGFEENLLNDEDTTAYGPMGGGYGVYLLKP